MLAVPTVTGLVESRKWVGSLLVSVRVSLEGGAAPKLSEPPCTRLLPMMGLLMLMAGAVTVVTICTGTLVGVKYPVGVARFRLVVPAVAGTKLMAWVK